ncbi:MAG: PDZ domain-containing protein [Pirellulaceae bacterium]|nr:PDZ domain-containing protein [Pirellulaceae bacterium]MDP7020639.1 PDZ domain-containing protein [Pirellulaceae bacterium]
MTRPLIQHTLTLLVAFALTAFASAASAQDKPGDKPKPDPAKKQAQAAKDAAAVKAAAAKDQAAKDAAKKQAEKEAAAKDAEKKQAEQRFARARAWLATMKWRQIGPASMGGRIVDLAVVESNPDRYWIATASGGLFKTANNGVTFKPQFQFQNSICIGDVAVAPSDPNILWVGTGENNARNSVSWGDGVYKSTDGGDTWTHMGLKDSFQIGRILIHPKNPEIVLVSALGRLWGDNDERGLYKTTDGGTSWTRVLKVDKSTGCMELARQPGKPDTILAATYERRRDPFDGGDPVKRFSWGSGLFKSTDGGDSWRRISKGLPTVQLGRIGLDFVKSKPNIVYAVVESEKIGVAPKGAKLPALMGIQGNAADGSAVLTVVSDGGPAQKAGLKAGDVVVEMGGAKIADYRALVAEIRKHFAGDTVEVKVKRGEKVIAVKLTFGRRGGATGRPFGTRLGGQAANVQKSQGENGHQTGGVFKSTDAGETWERVNSLNPRPFYFSQIRVDPNDENIVFVLGISLHRSTDGGKTFKADAGSATHPDHHAMWINPADSNHILLGCDGGLNTTYDGSQNWDFNDSLPIGQFYHVGVDTRQPYNVFGGLQDNGSWGGPSALRGSAGPTTHEWFVIGGGDGFICLADPQDPDIVYYESQYGNMARVNLRTGARNRIRPSLPEKEGKLRFNWKTPFVLSNHNSKIYYCLANRVFKSLERGDNLRVISPNLTATDRGTGTALAESSRNPNVLYAGTDDGNLWATTDGGTQWKKLRIKGLKGKHRVSSIEASRYSDGRAYVTFDGHYYDDDAAHVYATEDFGKTWQAIDTGLPSGSARVVREDARSDNVLYLGTEFGIWVSLDRGQRWVRLNNNLPHVAIHEIAVHPTASEIVAGTHGRSLWALDVAALRQFTIDKRSDVAQLFKPKTAVMWHGVTGKRFYGRRRFAAENPLTGGVIYYALPKTAKKVTLQITDVEGSVVANLRTSKEAGLHRAVWNLRRAPVRRQGPRRAPTPRLTPGAYLATLTVDGEAKKQTIDVVLDPDFPASTNTFDEDERLRKLKKVTDD